MDATGVERVHVKTSSTGHAVGLSLTEAPLTAFMAPPTAMRRDITVVSQWTVAHTCPATCTHVKAMLEME